LHFLKGNVSFLLLFNALVGTSVVDLDPHGSAFILVGWIWIRIGKTDPDRVGPKGPTKVKKMQVS
jgi:hypothetical protein